MKKGCSGKLQATIALARLKPSWIRWLVPHLLGSFQLLRKIFFAFENVWVGRSLKRSEIADHTYEIAKVIGMFSMKNFRSVPNKTANAFEPVEIIFVYKLKY